MFPLLPALLLLLMHGPLGAQASLAGRAWRAAPAVGVVVLAVVESEPNAARRTTEPAERPLGGPIGSWELCPHAEQQRLSGGTGECVRSRDGPRFSRPLVAAVGLGTSER